MNKLNTSTHLSFSLPNSPCESRIEDVNDRKQTRHLTPETELFLMKPFVSQRLNQWHTNEEVFKILDQCNQLSALALKNSYYKQLKEERFAKEPVRLPQNGSVLVFDRREVKNYKKDFFLWKRRKTGSSKSVREDRMSLKVNGIESIYGCYSHSYIMPTFHRRIYWLLGKPDVVLVHYLQIPNNESGECLLSINLKNSDFQFTKPDVTDQLRAMIWPYYLNIEFVHDNLKLNSLPLSSEPDDFKINFLNSICACLFESKIVRINFSKFIKSLNLTSNDLEQDVYNNNSNVNINHLADNEFKKHENFSTNQVKLSLDYCSSEGGERLMLISDWKSEQYHMIINEKILNLCKLNTHVLETLLPKFENLTSSMNKTLIYVFENQQLFCEPIPFEIKYNSVKSTNSDSYKNKFFLLERVLMLYKYYRLNIFDSEHPVQLSSNQDAQIPISFENRLGQMIENLISHLSVANMTSSSTGQYVFNDEHEGKTLVNLCIDLDNLSIFKCLDRLKTFVNLKKEFDLALLKNELDLFILDHHGINPLMLICRNGNQLIANEAFKWIENDISSEISSQIISSWIYSLLKSKEEASKHSHAQLVNKLDDLLERAQTKIKDLNANQSVSLTSELDLNLIDHIDLSSFLDNSENASSFFPTIELDHVITNSDLTNLLNQTDLEGTSSFNESSPSQAEQLIDTNDDHDDKIKTLADNIIAAMPHKIKVSNYSQNDYETTLNSVMINKAVHVLKRNSASFDENLVDFGDTNLDMIENCSTYSNRSSLSLGSSQSFQFLNEMQVKESSPDENSTSSSFHIDSPPSTAEFCQYFHASSSSRCSIETGFAQLTLTDAEQRELYEAALVIQNAYRRYMKRKKKFKSDLDVKLTPNSVFFSSDESSKNTNLYVIDSTVSLFDVNNTENNLVDSIHSQTYDLVTPRNSNIDIDQQKQFEAASIIQKYYRRYKQYEKLQNEAASKIQKRYRAYKLSDYRKNSFYHSSIDETSTKNHPYVYSNELPLNQRVIQRKILNMRQNSRFSPSSPVSSSNSLISSQIVTTRIGSDNSNDNFSNNDTNLQSKQSFNSILFETKKNINNFINTNIVEPNEVFNNR